MMMTEHTHHPSEQAYPRRSLLVYLAIMEQKAAPGEAVTLVQGVMDRGKSPVDLDEEITWAQFGDEASDLMKLLT